MVLAAGVCAALLLGGCSSSKEVELSAVFTDVGDLVNRANVQQSDTVVGRVESITLDGWTAKVGMRLQPGTRVYEGTRAVVRSTSLLGEKFVDLQPPPDASAQTPLMPDGATIPLDRTGKTPEVEQVFSQLGAILASGGLQDLGKLTTAFAQIIEGQQDDVGRVLDGTAKLVASLARQREAIAQAVDDLNSASGTLAGGTDTINRFLGTTTQVGTILASQTAQLSELVVQLDRLGQPAGELMRAHKQDMERSLKALLTIIPQVYAARADLDSALVHLPRFARLFADAVPGDYIQLDVHG